MADKKRGFFSFFTKKRDALEKELNDKITNQKLLITELKNKLEETERLTVDVKPYISQAGIIQKNLEGRVKENQELVEKLKVTEEALKELSSKCDSETPSKESTEAIDSIDSLNVNKSEGEQMQIVGDVFITKEEFELMKTELSNTKEATELLEKELENQKKLSDNVLLENHRLETIISKSEEKIIISSIDGSEDSLEIETNERKYKVPVETFFASNKFSQVSRILESYEFVDDIDFDKFKENPKDIKHIDLAISLIEDFMAGKYPWAIRTYTLKGPKLSKVFTRQRKLLTYFEAHYMEFFEDLAGFNIETLKENGFTKVQIENFEKTLKETTNLKR